LVELIEDNSWNGIRHFDSHPYRTEDKSGVWDFVKSSMRNYLIFKNKVKQLNSSSEIKALLNNSFYNKQDLPFLHENETLDQLKNKPFEIKLLSEIGYNCEVLDKKILEIILGIQPI
jgi:xylose isomerase